MPFVRNYIIGTRVKVMISQHRKRRGAATRQTRFHPPLSFCATNNENETKTTLAGRRTGARSFLRAGNFGELKLQGCARGTPASFFTAHDDPTADAGAV